MTKIDIFSGFLGAGKTTLIKKLIALLAEIYPEHYREELFSIYDTANSRIMESL